MFTTPSGQEIDHGWTLKIEVLSGLNFSVDQFDLSFSNLVGLDFVLVGGRAFGLTKMEFHDKREVGLTTLGTAFMKACTADADSETPSTAGQQHAAAFKGRQ